MEKNILGYWHKIDERASPLPAKIVRIALIEENLAEDEFKFSSSALVDKYIRPFIDTHSDLDVYPGFIFQSLGVDCKVVSCFPSVSRITGATRIVLEGHMSISRTIRKMSISAMGASEALEEHKDLVEEVVRPYFQEPRQAYLNQIFFIDGIQFKVIECDPLSGIVDESSVVYTSETNLPDVERVHVLPIYESLPNSEKNITEDQIFKSYLSPFLQGSFCVLEKEKKVTINGVDFYVVDMSPSYGVCTASTDFFAHGEPVTSDFVRGRQEQIDAEMALRLQREMAREAYGGEFPVFEPEVRQRDLDQVTLAIRSRLQQVIRTLLEEILNEWL